MAELEEVRSGRKIKDPHDYFEVYADGHAPVRRRRQGAPSWTSRLYPEFETLTEDQLAKLAARKQLMHRARHSCIDGLKVLAHIALIDGVASEEERNIELSYIESRLAMAGFDHDGELVDAMADIAFALAVPPNSYSRSCNRVSNDQGHFDLVLGIAITLAGIDGRIDDGESKALRRYCGPGSRRDGGCRTRAARLVVR